MSRETRSSGGPSSFHQVRRGKKRCPDTCFAHANITVKKKSNTSVLQELLVAVMCDTEQLETLCSTTFSFILCDDLSNKTILKTLAAQASISSNCKSPGKTGWIHLLIMLSKASSVPQNYEGIHLGLVLSGCFSLHQSATVNQRCNFLLYILYTWDSNY